MNIIRFALLAALPIAAWAADAKAQDSYAEYNRLRARRHFLTSPSAYKTYSGYTPGYSYRYATPAGEVREWQSPAYLHERISPRGYERYTGAALRGYDVTPWAPPPVVPFYRAPPGRPVPLPLPPPREEYYPPVP